MAKQDFKRVFVGANPEGEAWCCHGNRVGNWRAGTLASRPIKSIMCLGCNLTSPRHALHVRDVSNVEATEL